ncbi:MAG: TRAP transporter small permease [Alphaproteobacteria bacterium]|nr:TRAP transporter small permease [Alphaproteobacteria bacterium]
MGAIALVLLASVIGRYSGLYTLVWAEEAAHAMFIWMVLLGAAVAIERGGHFRLDVLEQVLPPTGRRLLRALAHVSLALFGLALLVTGRTLLANSVGQFTNALGLPQSTINAAIPCGGALMLFYSLRQLWHLRAAAQGTAAARPDGT